MSVCVREGHQRGRYYAVAGRLPMGGPDAWMAPLREAIEPAALLTRSAWDRDPWRAAAAAVGAYRAVRAFESEEAAAAAMMEERP